MKAIYLLGITMFLIFSDVSLAQWSDNAMMNTPVDISPFDQSIPKIAIRQADNSVFIAYFSSEGENYDLMLQYFTEDGYQIWPEPLVVSNHTWNGSIGDYAAMTDLDGNCIITFSDSRYDTPDIFAYKISPEGMQLWGDDGIRLSDDQGGETDPVLCITTDNNAIVSWTEMGVETGDRLCIAAIDPDGNLLWENGKLTWIPDGSFAYASPYLLPGNDGDFIIIYSENTGPFYAPVRLMYAQKCNISGDPVWSAEKTISDAGGLMAWTELSVKGDGEGGFYIAWGDDRDADNVLACYIQHIDATGNPAFTLNGLNVSTNPGYRNYYPMIAGLNDHNDVFVYWTQSSIERLENSLNGQRISTDGTKLWPENGLPVIHKGDGFYMLDGCDVQDNISYIFYEMYDKDSVYNLIRARSLDGDGNPAWGTDTVSVSEVLKQVDNTFVSDYFNGQWIMAWHDTRDVSNGNVYAQNINQDGTIGISTDIDEHLLQDVTVYPNPSSVRLNIRQNGFNQLCITSMTGQILMIKEIKEGETSISVSNFNPGMYMLKLTGKNSSMVQKIGVTGR